MPGLVPGIHDPPPPVFAWVAGTSPAMTREGGPPDAAPAQCRIWLRNSLVRSCCGFLKNSCGVFISTIWP